MTIRSPAWISSCSNCDTDQGKLPLTVGGTECWSVCRQRFFWGKYHRDDRTRADENFMLFSRDIVDWMDWSFNRYSIDDLSSRMCAHTCTLETDTGDCLPWSCSGHLHSTLELTLPS